VGLVLRAWHSLGLWSLSPYAKHVWAYDCFDDLVNVGNFVGEAAFAHKGRGLNYVGDVVEDVAGDVLDQFGRHGFELGRISLCALLLG
jgi:hypothetical protein